MRASCLDDECRRSTVAGRSPPCGRRLHEKMSLLATKANESDWLVVIDHHEARIHLSELHGTVPERIRPHALAREFRPNPRKVAL
jgi:hypothetical protein